MPPTALTYTYCTEEDLQALLSVDGTTARVDDNGDNSQSVTEALYLSKAISWATDRVNFYCLPRYAADKMAASWVVNNWAVVLAGHWLSIRRGNPSPGSLKQFYEETVEDLKLVHSGAFEIPGIGTREVLWPAWSNVRVDPLYILRKIRVERPISEKTSPQYRQNIDRVADLLVEF
jgi:hypothetical protein